jgi:hypothetical protein
MKGFWTALILFPLSLGAAPVTLVSVLPDRPVFSYVTAGLTQTRALAPGQRLTLEAGTFSGLGSRKIQLTEGQTYYLARFGASPHLYVLGPDQVLILNRSGRVVQLSLGETPAVSGPVVSESFALGQASPGGTLAITWKDGENSRSQDLAAGRVYQLVLGSGNDQTGLNVSLNPWD